MWKIFYYEGIYFNKLKRFHFFNPVVCWTRFTFCFSHIVCLKIWMCNASLCKECLFIYMYYPTWRKEKALYKLFAFSGVVCALWLRLSQMPHIHREKREQLLTLGSSYSCSWKHCQRLQASSCLKGQSWALNYWCRWHFILILQQF